MSFVVIPPIRFHRMPVAAQEVNLRVDDRIFAARELVAVVNNQYAQLAHRLGPGEV
jgi:hypothetical protein